MTKKILLGSTAMLGAAFMVAGDAFADSHSSVGVSGFSRIEAPFGDLDSKRGNDSHNFDFETDSEVHVNARFTDEETGLRYGATVEFESDTNQTGNTDEMWLFVEGGFGTVRFGDEDGASDNMKIGGYSVAAGTGGIDGDGSVAGSIGFTNSGDATKVRYDSPNVGGLTFGLSFTPDSGSAGSDGAIDNNGTFESVVEAGVKFAGSLGEGVDVSASLVGGFADNETAGEFSNVAAGATVGLSGFKAAVGFVTEDNDAGGNDFESFSAGVGAALGAADVSLTYLTVDNDNANEPNLLVASASVGLLPGLSLHGDVAFFDNDTGADDDGVTGVVRMNISY